MQQQKGGLSQPMNFRRMKFFKAVAVGFSGLSSLDAGIFPEPFLSKLNLGGQTPFTEMMMCFFLSCQYPSIHRESAGTYVVGKRCLFFWFAQLSIDSKF